MAHKKNIILGVTGSIAAYKAADIVSRLTQANVLVRVIMTKEAEHFITPLTLQMLSCGKVYREMFSVPEAWDVEHVSLAEAADLVVIAPATANMIAKLATGLCDDLLTCTVTATKAKVLLAPAMNDGMYTNPMVQENIARLKKIGYRFVGPVKGRLACGRVGVGRMSDVDEIVKAALGLV
jgi:phosphopantothenoylcysteine decarboxylase/phosphopantothenate--cysteine ligase